MTKHLIQQSRLIGFSVAFLIAPAAFCDSFTSSCSFSGGSCNTPSTFFEPGQSLTYAPMNPTIAPAGSPFYIGTFASVAQASSTTTTISLSLQDNTQSAAPVVFTGTYSSSLATILFAGTGILNIGGVNYATITEGAFTYGIEQQLGYPKGISVGKGTPLFAVYQSTVPEPSTAIVSLGLALVAGIVWRRRAARPPSV